MWEKRARDSPTKSNHPKTLSLYPHIYLLSSDTWVPSVQLTARRSRQGSGLEPTEGSRGWFRDGSYYYITSTSKDRLINANCTYFLPTATRSSSETGLGISVQQCNSRITRQLARATRLQDNFTTYTYTTQRWIDKWTVHTEPTAMRSRLAIWSGFRCTEPNCRLPAQQPFHTYCNLNIPARAACSGFLLSAHFKLWRNARGGILRGGARWRIGVGQPAPVNTQNSLTGVYYPYGVWLSAAATGRFADQDCLVACLFAYMTPVSESRLGALRKA